MNDVDRALAERAVRQHQVFSRQQSHEAGLTASGLYRRLRSGVYVACGTNALHFAGAELSYRGRLQAGLFDLGPHAVVAGRAAAALHRLDGFEEGPQEYLTLRSDRQRGRGQDYTVHSMPSFGRLDRVTVDGLPCASPTLAVVGLFATGTDTEAANALDSACRRRLTAVPVIRSRFAELGRGGRTGVGRFERAVAEAIVDSWLERRFLSVLRSASLPTPEVQQRYVLDGVGVVRVDFEFAAWGIVVEVGGRLGYMSAVERQCKERRRNALQIGGKTVYFFTRHDVVDDPTYVKATLTAALDAATWRRRTA